MSLSLPDPIAAYFRAQNAHDVDGMLLAFAPQAQVHDEGQDLAGPAAIRTWIEDTTRKYRPSVTPLDVEQVDSLSVVKVRVAGTFPGSPIDLRYRFRIEGRLIAALEIG
jgi:hypothetical protein